MKTRCHTEVHASTRFGWVCYDEDTWPERGSRMKARLEKALQLHPAEAWSKQVQDTKLKLVRQIQCGPMWTKLLYEREPVPCAALNGVNARRRRGRQRVRGF